MTKMSTSVYIGFYILFLAFSDIEDIALIWIFVITMCYIYIKLYETDLTYTVINDTTQITLEHSYSLIQCSFINSRAKINLANYKKAMFCYFLLLLQYGKI